MPECSAKIALQLVPELVQIDTNSVTTL